MSDPALSLSAPTTQQGQEKNLGGGPALPPPRGILKLDLEHLDGSQDVQKSSASSIDLSEHDESISDATPLLSDGGGQPPQNGMETGRPGGLRRSRSRSTSQERRVRFSDPPRNKELMYGLISKTMWEEAMEELYGQMPGDDLAPLIYWLSSILFVIIGGFWLLDSLKDTIFAALVGLQYQPWAKFSSVVFTLGLVLAYNSLVDRVSRVTLFYVVGALYTAIFLGTALLLASSPWGLKSTVAGPGNLLGWVCYMAIESYGSLAVAMFWAFTNSSVHLEGAKSVYGLILAGAQVGAIVGSTCATRARTLGIPSLFALGACSPALMALMIWRYTTKYERLVPLEAPPSRAVKKQGAWAGMMEGLSTVYQYPYVMALGGISCLYEIVLTILDYEMKVIGMQKLSRHPHASESFAEMMGHFGQLTNALSFFFSLFGTSYVVRKLGLPTTLRLFPTLLIVASIAAFLYPYLGVLFFFVSILKALSYALNEPCKEMLYIPTSDLIRFKAKSWIDVFGSRAAKAFGSLVTGLAKDNPDALVKIGSAPSWIISLVLLLTSIYMGRAFARLQQTGEVIGEHEDFWEKSGPHLGHGGVTIELKVGRAELVSPRGRTRRRLLDDDDDFDQSPALSTPGSDSSRRVSV